MSKKGVKIILGIITALVLILVLLIGGTTLYITYRKDKFLKLVNTALNHQVDGTILIGDLRPQFFKNFPNVSLGLENVIIRDKRYPQHHHTLLDAKNFDIALNTSDLLSGTLNVDHVTISNASVDLYTDSSGYSNTSLFKSGAKSPESQSRNAGSAMQLKQFGLANVNFKVADEKAKKRFDFVVNDLHGHLDYPDTGWKAAFHLDVMAKSMAFSTSHGSFIKNQALVGDFTAGFNNRSKKINVHTDALAIGDDPFRIHALFDLSKPGTAFSIHVATDELLWRHASALLAQNIKEKLDQFNMSQPIAVTAVISGSFAGADPYLLVTAKVRNNTVHVPGTEFQHCSFDGVFTNNYHNGKGLTDENSVIRLTAMRGIYNHIPFTIDTGSIINLVNPIATGNFKTTFPVADLNYLAGGKIAKFGNGTASVNLRYKADIVNYQLNKPTVSGTINLKNADINHLAGDLSLKNTSLTLSFVGNDLLLRNFRIQTGQSTVFLDGRVNNILNLYYNSPEKILLQLNVRSPQIHLAEFLGYLSGGDQAATPVKTSNSGNVITQLGNVFEKGNAQLHLVINNLHYNNFLATDVHAKLLTSHANLALQDVGLKTAGGSLTLNGTIQRKPGANHIAVNSMVSDVNVHDFFHAFDNFGLKDFTYENLRGLLSAKTQITASINDKASLLPKSIDGNIDISLRNGALLNFKPLVSVGKYAFPFRDLKNITIPKLDAHFAVHGDQITISPLQISSSVLNLDVAGVYGLSAGTNITLDVPLRNPKSDSTITDQKTLEKKRFRGIVLHLRAKADETGKIKIGFNKGEKDNTK